MRKLRDVSVEDLLAIEESVREMTAAQRKLRAAGATRAAAYARSALKSARGALRHALHCRWRAFDTERRSL